MFYSKSLKKNSNFKHCFFSRNNGISKGIYESLNCGLGSKDQKSNIKKNLDIVAKKFDMDSKLLVLMNQTHSNKVLLIEDNINLKRINSDAMLTKNSSIALGVLTADCAPILFFEQKEEIAGCIHAGWKGAINGVIENTLMKLREIGGNPEELVVCIGPCIGKQSYEVKEDFYSIFKNKFKENDSFFTRKDKKTFNFDLRGFVNKKFKNFGVSEIDNILIDTFATKNEYFSHRRAKKLKENDYGRCISVIKKITS